MKLLGYDVECSIVDDGIVSKDMEEVELVSKGVLSDIQKYFPYATRATIPLYGDCYLVIEFEENNITEDDCACVRFEPTSDEYEFLMSLW